MKKKFKWLIGLIFALIVISAVTFYLRENKILADATNTNATGLTSSQEFPNVPTDASLPAGTKANIDQSQVWNLEAKATKVVDYNALIAKSSYTGSDASTRYARFENQSVDSIIQNAVADQFYWMALKSTYTTQANALTTKPDLSTQAKVNTYIAGKTGMEHATSSMINFVYTNHNNLPLVLAAIAYPQVRYDYEAAELLDELGIYNGVDPSQGITSDNITAMLDSIPATQIIYSDGTLPFVTRFYSINTAEASTTAQATPTKNYASAQIAYADTISATSAQANINMAQAATWTNNSISTAIYPQYDSIFFNKDLLSGTNAQNLEAEMASYQIADPQGSEIKLDQLVNGTDPATNNFAKNINQNSSVITSFLTNQPSEKNYAFTQTAYASSNSGLVGIAQTLVASTKTFFTGIFGGSTKKNTPAKASDNITSLTQGQAKLIIDPNNHLPTVNIPLIDLETGAAVGTLTTDANGVVHVNMPNTTSPATIWYDNVSQTGFTLTTPNPNLDVDLPNAESAYTAQQKLVRNTSVDAPQYSNVEGSLMSDVARWDILGALKLNVDPADNTYFTDIDVLTTKPDISTVATALPIDPTTHQGNGSLKALEDFSKFFRIDPLTGKAEIGYADTFGSGIFINSSGQLVGTYSLHGLSSSLSNTMLYYDSSGELALGQKFGHLGTGTNSATASLMIDSKGNISGSVDVTKLFGTKLGYGVGLSFDKSGLTGVTIPFGSIGSLGNLNSGFGIGIDKNGNLSFSVFVMVGPIPISVTLGFDAHQNLQLSWLGGSLNISRLFGWEVKDPRPRTKPNPSTTDDNSIDFSTFWFPTTVTNFSFNILHGFTTTYTVWNEVASSNTADQQARAQVIVDTYKELIYRPPTQTEFANMYFYTGLGHNGVGDVNWADDYAPTENATITAITNDKTNKCTKSVADSTLQNLVQTDTAANSATDSTTITTAINANWACAIKATNQTKYSESDFDLANWLTDMQQQAEQNQTTSNTTPIATATTPVTNSNNNNGGGTSGGILSGGTLVSTGLSIMVLLGATILILGGYTIWEHEKKKKKSNSQNDDQSPMTPSSGIDKPSNPPTIESEQIVNDVNNQTNLTEPPQATESLQTPESQIPEPPQASEPPPQPPQDPQLPQ